MAQKKEPMIEKESRPTAIDFDAPIADWKVRDLVAVIGTQVVEHLKYTPVPERKETWKPEKEILKPEKELWKPEKEIKPEQYKPEQFKPEITKPEKEALKPEKEFQKPERKPLPVDIVEQVVAGVVEALERRGLFK